MCKFENDSAPGFAIVVEGIMRYAEDAPASIKSQWETEREERDAQKKATAKAIYPGLFTRKNIFNRFPTDWYIALGTPQSGSMTTPSSSPGKTQAALPAPRHESFLESNYTVEEVGNKDLQMEG